MNLVEKLRKSGARVHITHYREFVELDGLHRPIIKTHARHEIPEGDMKYALPRGGYTVVEITKPNGVTIKGVGTCSLHDNYCKREGVKAAIKNAGLNALLAG